MLNFEVSTTAYFYQGSQQVAQTFGSLFSCWNKSSKPLGLFCHGGFFCLHILKFINLNRNSTYDLFFWTDYPNKCSRKSAVPPPISSSGQRGMEESSSKQICDPILSHLISYFYLASNPFLLRHAYSRTHEEEPEDFCFSFCIIKGGMSFRFQENHDIFKSFMSISVACSFILFVQILWKVDPGSKSEFQSL